MTRGLIAAATMLALLLAWESPAQAARICKDGYLTYTGSAPSPSRTAAETSAKQAWRTARAMAGRSTDVGLLRPNQLRCFRGEDRKQWRCYIRAGRCTVG